ncbi:MAG: hypothetical protein R2771_04135 [Saprospiraceae bacterium]
MSKSINNPQDKFFKAMIKDIVIEFMKGISINDLSDITGLSISKVREIIEKDLK